MTEDEDNSGAVGRCNKQIAAVADDLGLPDSVVQAARLKFMQAADEWFLSGRGIDNMATAALIIAGRQNGHALSIEEVIEKWEQYNTSDIAKSYNEKNVNRTMRSFRQDFDEQTTILYAGDVIDRYGDRINAPEEFIDVAQSICSLLEDQDSYSVTSYSPQGVAAGILYLTARINDLRPPYTQRMIEDNTDVAAATIRDRYQEIRESLVDALIENNELDRDFVEETLENASSPAMGYDTVFFEIDRFLLSEEVRQKAEFMNDGWPDDVTEFDGIGEQTAKALHKAGYKSVGDVVTADTQELRDVDMVDEKIASRLQDGIDEAREILGPHPVEASTPTP